MFFTLISLMTFYNGFTMQGACQSLHDITIKQIRPDLSLADITKERHIIPHHHRITHYFRLLLMPKPCLSPRYV